MTEELKARIAQINAGTAPAGYKKTKAGIVPEEWGICHFKKQFARLRRKNTEGNTNVLTISAQYGLINQEEFFKKEIASEDKSNYYLLYRGDFAYNKSYSNGYPFGAFKMLDRYDSGVVSPLYICFTPTESNECPAFYVQYFENGMMNREIQAVAQEGARNHGLLNISIDDFFNSYLLCPPLPEQQKIAEILTAQDAVIALMQKQIELLQKQKKAFLQKMFPKKGCNVPEIRFDGFTGDWKRIQFSDLFERRMERNGGQFDNTRWISVAKMYFQTPDKVMSNNIDTRTYVMRLGDIAFEGHPNSEYQLGRFVENDIGDGVISELFPIYKHKGEYDLLFWKYYINYESIMFPILVRCIEVSYTSSNKLDNAFFLKESILVPELDEQRKIGALLDSIDKVIATHQRKLEIEQQKKKALMQLLLTGKVRCIK